jgi:hypothetical protein
MPVQLSVKLRGAELVRQGLKDLRAEVPKIGAQDLYDALKRARAKVIKYPPPPPGSRYRRTGTYGRAWTVRRNPTGRRQFAGYTLIGHAVQRVREYTKYVGGDAYGLQQAMIHEGRWVLARDAIEAEMKKLPRITQDHIDTVARRVPK